MGGIQQFFDGLSKATDILNLGRLIFYTAAGALVVLPACLIGTLFLNEENLRTVSESLWTAVGLLVTSMVVGFLIAAAAFPLVIDDLSADVRREMTGQAEADEAHSFPRNYPVLRGKGGVEDYAAWLISEYYRYVEIAAYIPLGGIIGLVLVDIYVLLVLLRESTQRAHAGLTVNHVLFAMIFVALIVIRYWLWPEVWAKRVIAPTIRTYLRAKQQLIDGVKGTPAGTKPG